MVPIPAEANFWKMRGDDRNILSASSYPEEADSFNGKEYAVALWIMPKPLAAGRRC